VAWHYLSRPPEDGTLFLEWIPFARSFVFASDGYAWPDPERTQENEIPKQFTGGMFDGEYVRSKSP
jgi:hypothetical protein